MTDSNAFTKLVPGFDFLQGLMKNATGVVPAMGQWIAPTLDPAELEKRISELKTVKFWLEQNSRMLDATIQALEVQRMTLATLKGMNMPLADLRQAMVVQPAAVAPAPPPAEPPAAPAEAAPQPKDKPAAANTASAEPAGLVDPMKWWGALTQQFSELASNAMKDAGAAAASQARAKAAPAAPAKAKRAARKKA